MKKRYWAIGGVLLVGFATLIGRGSSPAGLCSRSSTTAAINEAYVSKLSQLGARLRDDFVVHGKQGEAVLCSVSFELKPLTRESMAQMDKDYKEPTNATEVEQQALRSLMLPSLLVHAGTNPGEPLVQRITYRVNQTVDGRPVVTLVNFPGSRG
jgi:hypothetical protein